MPRRRSWRWPFSERGGRTICGSDATAGSTSTTIPSWHRAACQWAPDTRGACFRAKPSAAPSRLRLLPGEPRGTRPEELAPGGARAVRGVFCGAARPQGRQFGGVGHQRGRHGADRSSPGAGGGWGQGTGSAADAGIAGAPVPVLETAGLTRVRANEPAANIGRWMDAVRDAAKTIEVAPGHPLDRLLFMSCTDWDRERVHARVREAAREFPEVHVPQGFVCFPVLQVGERSLPVTSKYGELEVVSRIKRPTIGGRAVSGPYLFFGVVAPTTRRRGYECVRGWRSRSCRSTALCRWIRTSSAGPSVRSRRRCGYWARHSRILSSRWRGRCSK